MNRRGFLGAILAAGAAPAVVKYANLMPVFRRAESGLLTPLWGTSIAAQIADKQREFNRTLDDLIYEISPVETPLMVVNRRMAVLKTDMERALLNNQRWLI